MSTKKRGGGSRRDKYLRRKYGIDESVYREMLKAQGGKCAICRRPPKAGKNLHVDHDHVSGLIRGLLDFRCNRRLVGRHRDGTLLRAAADYLDRDIPVKYYAPKPKRKRRRKK